MAIVKGTVEAVSTKWEKYSVLVDGKWYATKMEWATVKPTTGQEVEFDDGGKNYLKNVKVTGGSASAAPSGGGRKGGYNQVGVELGHASKLAMDMTLASPMEVGSPEFWKQWVTNTETVHRLMTGLRDKYEGGISKPEEKVVVMNPKSEESDIDVSLDEDLFG